MCGICGVIGVESRSESESITRRMMAAMHHRGPDEEGILSSPYAMVGMRRLSIIDLPGGSQPIWNETETLAVVFNGEIYNFREIRAELESLGHRFRTRSDTEVIVHAYEAWGETCVERLHGMFAFAIVEMPQGKQGPATAIFLARDPLGIKPLYYIRFDGKFLFASEVRTLLASGCVAPEVCPETISAYLLFGSVCEPMTLVNRVRSLPPGHSLKIPVGKSVEAQKPKRYWPAKTTTPHASDGGTSPARKVRELLENAVASHLIADVPVGVFLSSGIDSTAIATLASKTQSGIHTFTVGFPDAEFSEADAARRTAKRLGTQHLEVMLSDTELLSRLDEAVAAFDQPSMDGINTYFVSWAAREAGLKVALSGLGSDELFGGYDSFHSTPSVARTGELANHLPTPIRRLVASTFDHIWGSGDSPDRVRKATSAIRDSHSLPHPYFFTRLLFTPEAITANSRSWRQTGWWQWLGDCAGQAESMDDFTAVSWLELRSYMLNTLLRDTDAVSMRSSLEVRVPFLDTPLVEYVLSVPGFAKSGTRRKELLLSALGNILPEETRGQKTKKTFTFPWQKWFRGPLGKTVSAGMSDWSSILEPHISRDFAIGVWQDFLNGRTSWSRPWSLYVLNECVKRNLSANRGSTAICEKPAAVA
jgi:asparagine synthase (glutamine-hydrolysing)